MTMFVAVDYAGDILGESAFSSILWNNIYKQYTPDFIRENEIRVMSRDEYARRYADV